MTRLEVINNQIDEIMDTFDFRKVHEVMKMLEWEWMGNGVPEEYDLRVGARKLMKNLIDFKDGGVNSSGGFKALLTQKVSNKGTWLRVDLSFCIDDTLLDGEYYE